MKNVFNPSDQRELITRLDGLRPDNVRQWGAMSPSQMLAHCSKGIEMATGSLHPPRSLIGRLLGPVIKPLALKDDAPMRRNSPTVDCLVINGEPDFDLEREHLRGLLQRFGAGGREACTAHPHSFFGRLTPDEWSILVYKHLDHHFRQFGA
jgi:hypothetical protein